MPMFALNPGQNRTVKTDDSPEYDTKDGILAALDKGLAEFLALAEARHKAGYIRGERLDEWVVLGRWYFDTCGNCSKAFGKIPAELIPNHPPVMRHDEFWEFFRQHRPNGSSEMLSWSLDDHLLDNASLVCAHCGKGWDITNFHDVALNYHSKIFPLTEFTGKTLAQVRAEYPTKPGVIVRLDSGQDNTNIRHDRYIDLTPKYPEPTEEWQKTSLKNEHGWIKGDESYVVQPGDEGRFWVFTYTHPNCKILANTKAESIQVAKMFQDAGFQRVDLQEIPNEYCQEPDCTICTPWHLVTTEFGIFKIGWRKRVYELSWAGLRPEYKEKSSEILPLFDKENVTKGESLIHAWGDEKATEYLTKIFQLLSK